MVKKDEKASINEALRGLPGVDTLLKSNGLSGAIKSYSLALVTEAVQEVLETLREAVGSELIEAPGEERRL